MWKSLAKRRHGPALYCLSLRLRSIAAAAAEGQGSPAREPGMAQDCECLHRELHAGATLVCRAIRTARIRRPAPDLSAHGIKREIARLHDQRDQITAVDPKALAPREQFDRNYLLAVVDRDLFWIEKTKFPFSNPGWYLGQIDPDMYLSRNYAPLEKRMKAYIRYARASRSSRQR